MLEECGLMMAQSLSLKLRASINQHDFLYNSKVIGVVKGKKTESQELIIPVYIFTASGSQLIKAIQPQVNSQYFIEYLEIACERYKDLVFSAHEIKQIDDGVEEKINYNEVDILPAEQT